MRTHTMPHLLIILIILSTILSLSGCGSDRRDIRRMDLAETLMEERPDSSLLILDSIDTLSLKGDHAKARYALLRSIALDKNCIDTADFSVIQPAVDYYLRNGSPREKLRTYYYQGRIYHNAGKANYAMECYENALSAGTGSNDTMTMALVYLAKSVGYFNYFDLPDYTKNAMKAAWLYNRIGNPRKEFFSLMKAIEGAVMIHDRQLADSLIARATTICARDSAFKNGLIASDLAYHIEFEDNSRLKERVEVYEWALGSDNTVTYELFDAYCRLGLPDKAAEALSLLPLPLTREDSIKYLANEIDFFILEENYKRAYESLKTVSDIIGIGDVERFEEDLRYEHEGFRHKMDLVNKVRNRERTLIICVSLIIILILVIALVHRNRCLQKSRNKIIEEEKHRLELEAEVLEKEKSRMALEKLNAELETARQVAAMENLKLYAVDLERECEDLKDIVAKRSLTPEARQIFDDRIRQINRMLASQIIGENRYSKEIDNWIAESITDKKEFIRKNRIAFEVSHPNFMDYLKECGLTDKELDYICLYAIGLNGKEIGNFLQESRHYTISTQIRKKLSLSKSTTNLRRTIDTLLKKG